MGSRMLKHLDGKHPTLCGILFIPDLMIVAWEFSFPLLVLFL